MKITICTFGSRGDTQPYVALAMGLQQRGHHVTLVASRDLAERDIIARLLTSANVLYVDDVPQSWLFPRMAAMIVHHGGAGTTAAGLRAGVPGLITLLCWINMPGRIAW